MRLAAFFTGLIYALPTVLGSASETTWTSPNGLVAFTSGEDTSLAARSEDTWTAPNGLTAFTSGDDSLAARDMVELQSRQIAEAAIAIATIISGILGQVQRDNLGRGEFTRMTVTEGRNKFPHLNWVICHTRHRHAFDGQQGRNWGHYHREYDIRVGGTIGYEIYWFESGRFERHGDGGWLNWAYIGDVVRTENNGATVIFR